MHELAENIVPLTAIILIFGGGAISHFVKGLLKVMEMKAAQQNGVNSETSNAIAELRREVAALRETSTRFDMSFDAAITRLEQRMDFVEGQSIPSSATNTTPTAYQTTEAQPSTALVVGRGAQQ